MVLEVGGGANPRFRPNLDVRPLPTVDIVADLGGAWPVPDGGFDGVYSAYVMEHISWRKVPVFVGEIWRVLRPGGTATVVTSNTEAQMRWALRQEVFDEKIGQCLFGDNDYPENTHRAAFNPDYVIRLFREAGFTDVFVQPAGELRTDMVIEARKGAAIAERKEPMASGAATVNPAAWDTQARKEAYGREYFDGGHPVLGGYAREGYWDYPCHWTTFREIMALHPESVLELGCARGYVLKRLQDAGIRGAGLEVSRHCYLTRVCENVIEWDVTQIPWPFKDQEFDLCYSTAFWEHIPEHLVPAVAAEMRRVSKRGLHGVDLGQHDDGFDKTHCTFKPVEWWGKALDQKIADKEHLERPPYDPPGPDGLVKVNCGSFTTMFHHGWLNIDTAPLEQFAIAYGYQFRRYDLRFGLPFSPGTVDLLYASHFLEHLTYEDGLGFLKAARAALKPGGILRLAVPSAWKLMERYRDGTMGELDPMNASAASYSHDAPKLWTLLFTGHQSLYDGPTLLTALKLAGFENSAIVKFRESSSVKMRAQTLDLFPEISLFVEAKA